MLLAAGCNGNGESQPASGIVHFVPNSHAFWSNPSNWTTSFGPAYADITLASSNFVPCRGGPFALCYYSGPSSGPEDLSCTLTADGNYANCQCFDIPYGVYFVDINAILNHEVYENTIAQCGADGSLCATLNSAPVCANVNQKNLIPGSSIYSTFSFDCVPENGLGLTNCSNAPYAGCMTAPCFKTGQAGIVKCSCPVFNGPYQVGQNDQACTLGDDLVWSAAYQPAATPTATPVMSALSADARADPLLPRFPVLEHASRTRLADSDARCMCPAPRCCRPTATLIAPRSARSTTVACNRKGLRRVSPATPRYALTNATTGTW